MTKDPEYQFDDATEQLFFRSGRATTPIGDRDIAVAWTEDEDGACLMKHGVSDLVKERAESIRVIDPSIKVATVPWEAIKHPEAGPRILGEINACLAISGRVGKFEERLSEIAQSYDIEIFPRNEEDPSP